MPDAMHRLVPEAVAHAQVTAIYAYMLTVSAASLAAGILTGWIWAWRARP